MKASLLALLILSLACFSISTPSFAAAEDVDEYMAELEVEVLSENYETVRDEIFEIEMDIILLEVSLGIADDAGDKEEITAEIKELKAKEEALNGLAERVRALLVAAVTAVE